MQKNFSFTCVKRKKILILQPIMVNEGEKRILYAMYRRWAYMAIAIIATMVMLEYPMFRFHEDRGIKYVRSFSIEGTTFCVTQTEMDTGISQITATMSVKGLYYCNKLMLWGTILCFLCFFSNRWRIRIAVVTAIIAGAYYAFMAYYAIRIADDHYATLSLNITAILPAIVCQMMVLTWHNIMQSYVDKADFALENYSE